MRTCWPWCNGSMTGRDPVGLGSNPNGQLAPVAQRIERQFSKPDVEGSSPSRRIKDNNA